MRVSKNVVIKHGMIVFVVSLKTKSACNSCCVIYEQHAAIKKPPPRLSCTSQKLLLRCDYDALVLSTGYVVERALEMFPRVLEAGCVLV